MIPIMASGLVPPNQIQAIATAPAALTVYTLSLSAPSIKVTANNGKFVYFAPLLCTLSNVNIFDGATATTYQMAPGVMVVGVINSTSLKTNESGRFVIRMGDSATVTISPGMMIALGGALPPGTPNASPFIITLTVIDTANTNTLSV